MWALWEKFVGYPEYTQGYRISTLPSPEFENTNTLPCFRTVTMYSNPLEHLEARSDATVASLALGQPKIRFPCRIPKIIAFYN